MSSPDVRRQLLSSPWWTVVARQTSVLATEQDFKAKATPPPPHFICLRQLAECGSSKIVSMKLDTKLNTGVGASVNKICQLSSVSLKRGSFTGKKFYGITIILLMYQSAMLYKYKQNITFNVINTQIHTKKKNP